MKYPSVPALSGKCRPVRYFVAGDAIDAVVAAAGDGGGNTNSASE